MISLRLSTFILLASGVNFLIAIGFSNIESSILAPLE